MKTNSSLILTRSGTQPINAITSIVDETCRNQNIRAKKSIASSWHYLTPHLIYWQILPSRLDGHFDYIILPGYHTASISFGYTNSIISTYRYFQWVEYIFGILHLCIVNWKFVIFAKCFFWAHYRKNFKHRCSYPGIITCI